MHVMPMPKNELLVQKNELLRLKNELLLLGLRALLPLKMKLLRRLLLLVLLLLFLRRAPSLYRRGPPVVRRRRLRRPAPQALRGTSEVPPGGNPRTAVLLWTGRVPSQTSCPRGTD